MNQYWKHVKIVAKAMFTNSPIDQRDWQDLKDGAFVLYLLLLRLALVVLCPITVPVLGFISMKVRR